MDDFALASWQHLVGEIWKFGWDHEEVIRSFSMRLPLHVVAPGCLSEEYWLDCSEEYWLDSCGGVLMIVYKRLEFALSLSWLNGSWGLLRCAAHWYMQDTVLVW